MHLNFVIQLMYSMQSISNQQNVIEIIAMDIIIIDLFIEIYLYQITQIY